ncbi:MAG TPA: hypothetical protein VNV82_17680 [Bryobacteraceae bacterium]|jgi:hypothetical protein|nr:hypothetical protein [Bryobacteraceae bacterium]
MPAQDRGIDLIAYDYAGHAILVGEVKSRVGTSEQWAALFRRNMLAHGILPRALFFLIATPERIYFWKQDKPGISDEPPAFTIDVAKEFKQYFEKLGKAPQAIGEQALELLVLSWLTDIARTGKARVKEDASMRWLADSGFIESLEHARFEMNPA